MVFRTVIFLCLLNLFALGAQKIEVYAKDFYLDEKNETSTLTGDVEVKKGGDILNSQKLVIYMKNKQPVKYIATHNAKFKISMKDKTYHGSGDEFVYNVAKDTYEINGHAKIIEVQSKKELTGDKIIVDRKNMTYRVLSKDKKPAKFVFEVKE
ncbi:putative lipooligosaccharide transport system, periplasmic component (LptA family) [Campylobacter subantarcticus LMG 24377]|uniref:Lipopolysaccharide transport periplasmic protein LptA n=2 Tax=Campylobacter subantarcticus TaxID=497724 RepID=A0ABW9N663_9BACT|nr:lipopolysaccharide transport periplasmic protein LptA [Campylobacter subantarcticus]EAJ1260621.1 lipopolysaccharide transport periplasmic protein LptA [Campylobacter lari]AJC90549.1 putative lipooligosaccharide transport system, periplasmic component (LptA family) [Campylobacter subantarcticus LMG 24374]AJC92309.1 putative lipooligosaccharide transport system, periplasmic component (LptA family) [Campylobacter subantarcticus LMG 24377]EAL3938532.1 lipopolysaccharide transport periplasmic pro